MYSRCKTSTAGWTTRWFSMALRFLRHLIYFLSSWIAITCTSQVVEWKTINLYLFFTTCTLASTSQFAWDKLLFLIRVFMWDCCSSTGFWCRIIARIILSYFNITFFSNHYLQEIDLSTKVLMVKSSKGKEDPNIVLQFKSIYDKLMDGVDLINFCFGFQVTF